MIFYYPFDFLSIVAPQSQRIEADDRCPKERHKSAPWPWPNGRPETNQNSSHTEITNVKAQVYTLQHTNDTTKLTK